MSASTTIAALVSKNQPSENPPPLLQNRNIRWLLGGGAISMLGDQFTLVALPWLVLQLTRDPLALGAALAAMSIPRALLVLFGGALVDRHSPTRILIISKCVNAGFLGVLAILVLHGNPRIEFVYGIAFGIGSVSAFGLPSSAALLPKIVDKEQLSAANSLFMGINQFATLFGPVLAGTIIGIADRMDPGMHVNTVGLGFSFLFDSFSFILSSLTLSQVIPRKEIEPTNACEVHSNPLKAIYDSLCYFWNDRGLRACCLYWSAIAFCIGGPIQVGMPILASTRLKGGATALGFMFGAHGAGTLLGMAATFLKSPRLQLKLGTRILLADGMVGALILPMGFVVSAWQGSLILFLVGALNGFIQIAIFSWTQKRIPSALLGRAMSLFMFILMTLSPISVIVTGWLLRRVGIENLFIGSGALLICVILIASSKSQIPSMTESNG
jgi:MFS family permease